MSNKKVRKVVTPARRQPRSRSRAPLILLGAGFLVLVVAISMSVSGEAGGSATPTVRDPAVVAAGAELFTANCAVCHGADLQGTSTGPPFLHPYYAPNHHADEAFQRAVAFGVVPHHWNFGEMAPLPHLTRDDVEKIVAFVRAEQEAAGIYEDPSH